MIKRLTKKSLSIILCVTVLLSCMVFAMPTANAATAVSYKARVYINCTNSFTGDNMTLTVKGKADNATAATEEEISSLSSTTISTGSGTIFDNGKTMYYPGEDGVTISKVFPTSLTSSANKSSGWVITYGAYTTTLQVYNNSTGEWVDVCSGSTGNFRSEGSTDCSVSSDKYPTATFPTEVTTTPANTVTLNGTGTKTVTVNAANVADQYGVLWSREITYSNPVYNPDAFSISGTTLSITKDAHISEEGMNKQSITIKTKYAGQETINTRLFVEDEKYTATYKWYESNEADPASPTEKTQAVTGIYYGDFPTDEQVPEAIDNYYTDTQHFTNGQFPALPTDNTYIMAYNSASHTMLTKVEDEATCQGPGTTKHYCNCGYSYIEEGNPAQVDHSYVAEVVDPTCTEQGYTLHTCRFCGINYKDTYISELGHNDRRIAIKEATCTEDGSRTFKCRRCSREYTEVIPATGHDWASMVVDPTCTEGGYTIYACNNCSETNTTDYTEPLGHDHQLYEDIPATCTAAGKQVYKCTRCDDSYTVDIDAKGHDFGDWVVTTEPTCTEPGVKTAYCSRCDEVKTAPVDATGHDHQKTTVDPTCDKQGYDLYKCSKCGDEYTENYTDALGHLWDDGEVTQQPTCTVDGVKTFTCSRCQGTKTEAVTATGHNYQQTEVVEPTCTEQGYTVFTCENCNDTYNDNFTDALDHNFSTSKITTAPTCTEKGVRTYYCSRCEATYDEPVDELGHDYIPNVVAPTCTEQGYTEYNCSRCTDSYKGNYVDSLGGHLFTDYYYNEDATCTADGTETATCDRCDATDTRTATGTMLGHQFTTYVYNEDATCTADGTETAKCDRCDVTDTRTAVGTILGHQFTTYVYNEDATCTENGTETAKCDRCDATDKREAKDTALGHDEIVNNVSATCTTAPYTETTCSRCDYYNKQITGEALGHNFGDWQEKTAPSCGVPGENIRYCSRCTEFETEPVAALEHHWTQIVDEPGNETNGYVYYKCDNCSKYRNAVLDASTNTAIAGDDIFESADLVKADTLEISAPTFNKYYNEDQQYDYSTRGAALKYSDPTYIDDYTTQDTRFTASLFIPSNIDISFSGASDNKVTDFGFVFAQTQYIESDDDLQLGKDAYSISVPERNADAGDISNWSGVTVHDDSFGGSTLTFNLLLKIKAKNWTKDYSARAYVTYNQNGFTYTVYDNVYTSRSVADIARAVIASDSETQEAKDYCQTKIIDNLNIA